MFSSIKGFVSRHRRKFIVTGVVVGSLVVAARYAQRKFQEWQEREAREFMERTRKQQHFESTERTCNQTVMSLAPTISEVIVKTVNIEEKVDKLKSGHPDKIPLWEELKILAFTQACVLVYAGAMFVVTLRIQLNLIGGYMFRDSSEATPGSLGFSNALQEKYLSLCHHFMNQGIAELSVVMQQKVHKLLGNLSLKHKLNLHDTEQTFWDIQGSFSSDPNDPIKNMARYLLPLDKSNVSGVLKGKDAELLNVMLVETIDILESDEVRSLTSALISCGFSHIVDRITEYLMPTETKKSSLNAPSSVTLTEVTDETSLQALEKPKDCAQLNGIRPFVHPNSVSIPLAKLIPVINVLLKSDDNVYVPDPWILHLINDEKLKLLGANIYEAFSNKS